MFTHQTPIGKEASPSADSRLDHLQRNILRDDYKVPVKVDGVHKLHKGNHVPGEDKNK